MTLLFYFDLIESAHFFTGRTAGSPLIGMRTDMCPADDMEFTLLIRLKLKRATHTGRTAGSTAGSPLAGTCTDMCPADERELRQRTQSIRMFERVNPRDSGHTSADLAVKSFARTGVRFISVLPFGLVWPALIPGLWAHLGCPRRQILCTHRGQFHFTLTLDLWTWFDQV